MSQVTLIRTVLERCLKSDSAGTKHRQIDDEKTLYESSRTDSGFISSGNILVSGDNLQEEEFKEQNVPPQQPPAVQEESYSMRLDSGVSLTDSFSNLSLKSGWNDLGTKGAKTSFQEPTKEEERPQSAPELPWKSYYEQDEDGDTYLHSSIVEGFVEVAFALIRLASHPRLLDTPNDNCQTPLHLAVETKQSNIVRWLIVAGAQPGVRDHMGDMPLHIAARNGDLGCVKAITEPVEKQDRDALQLSYPEKLINQTSNLDQWNSIGQTCVHVAAEYGQIDVLRHLVWHGADINARDGCNGYTALYYAIEKQNEPLVHFLLTECVNFNPHIECYNKRTVLEEKTISKESILMALQRKGVRAVYFSSEEDSESSEEESDIEMHIYDSSNTYVSNLVDASA